MATEIIPAISSPGSITQRIGYPQLVAAFLSGKSDRTVRAYRSDLEDFCVFARAGNLDEAARLLLAGGHGTANLLALNYRNNLVERKLSPATINRRLAALRSLVDLGNTLGLVPWSLSVPGLKSMSYRDTKGPGLAGFKALLAAAGAQLPKKAARDKALLWLLFCPALRRAEAETLDLEHVDLGGGTLEILGKGKLQRERLSIPTDPLQALQDWIRIRGNGPGPLFYNFDRAKKGSGGLAADGIYRVIKKLGERADIRARPHGLRHAGITLALDATNGNVRSVQRFSRHADVRTLSRYDDNRTDLGGNVAQLVASKV